MNVSVISLVFISYLVGFGFLLLIRHYDKYDKEPIGRLILFTFVGGIVSVIAAGFLYFFVHPQYNLTDAILKIGTVEEGAKLITLFVLYKMIQKDYDEIVDGIIYIAAISLGFSVIENIFYALKSTNPYPLLAQRFLFATIGHISFSVYMGIAFYIHKKVRKNYGGLLLAFIISSLAHGLYDGFIFNRDLIAFFIPTYLLLIYFQFRLLKVSFAYSKLKKKLKWENLQPVSKNSRLECCNCQTSNMAAYHFEDIDVQICKTCHHAIIHTDDFKKLLKYFRPKLNRKKYNETLLNINLNGELHQKQKIQFHSGKGRVNTDLQGLEDWFYNGNKNDVKKYQKSYEGIIFRMLGFRYIQL